MIAVIGFGFTFVPVLVGFEGMSGGFAISLVSFFVGVMGLIVAWIYSQLASILSKILRGYGLLFHWTYTPEMWMKYASKEYAEERSEKKGLFIVVSAFALFFGFLFWAIDTEHGFIVFIVMLGLIVACGLAWQLTAWQNYRINKRFLGEAYISKAGVYLNRRLYTWRLLWSSLTKVTLENKHGLSLLVFEYSAFTIPGPQSYAIRVPIPEGQEEAAKTILKEFNTTT
jgi:hypothetical protein